MACVAETICFLRAMGNTAPAEPRASGLYLRLGRQGEADRTAPLPETAGRKVRAQTGANRAFQQGTGWFLFTGSHLNGNWNSI